MLKNFLDVIDWHSSLGFLNFTDKKKVLKKLPNTKKNRAYFVPATHFLIHRKIKCLWQIDGKFLVPVFESDAMTNEELITDKNLEIERIL
jgi:hypothetical protein